MNAQERRLLSFFRGLSDESKKMLASYAEFLATRAEQAQQETATIEKPDILPAKENETVVGAIKRLSASYYMLKSPGLLNSASNLMSQHIMLGRDTLEVISELESLFESQYVKYCEELTKTTKD